MNIAPRVWLFDLDNTLHDADPHIFPHIHRLMTDYLCKHLQLDSETATQLRERYWARYGITLLGMMRNHGTDPHHFLHHTHQIPDLEEKVIAERGLDAMLQRLPGKKIIFSNAPLQYIEDVIAVAGIARRFNSIYSIERLRFEAKPSIGGFIRVLRNEGLNPRSCVMVEDTLPNLKTAKRLGMKTVWVSANTRRPPYVDVRVPSVIDLPSRLAQL